MAKVSSIDKLNNLQTEKDIEEIEQFFEEMELDRNDIDERIDLAKDIDNMYLWLFLILSASVTLGQEIDYEYWRDFLYRGYSDIYEKHGYNPDTFYDEHTSDTIDNVLKTTEEHIADEYYLSNDRAIVIAVNDANSLGNYNQHIQAIKDGFTKKRWVTKLDKKVRHTHRMADGQERDIQLPFNVGNSKMLFPLDTSLGAEDKECINCRCTVIYLDKDILSEDNDENSLFTGARIVNPDSEEGQKFAEMYYPEIRLMKNDVRKISSNTGYSVEEIQSVKKYLFLEKSFYNEFSDKWEYFPPDCAIAQSWQRLKDGNIKPHDTLLIKHELEEISIKQNDIGIKHIVAHRLAEEKYNYTVESRKYYDSLKER